MLDSPIFTDIYKLFELLDIKSPIKSTKSSQVDFAKFNYLAERMKNDISVTTGRTLQLAEIIERSRQPDINERKINIYTLLRKKMLTRNLFWISGRIGLRVCM